MKPAIAKPLIDNAPNPKLFDMRRLEDACFSSVLIPGGPGMQDGNAELILTLRVLFVPVMRKTHGDVTLDADGEPYQVVDWDLARWQEFKERALARVNLGWNNQLWLVNTAGPRKYYELDYDLGGMRFRPSVRCSLIVCEAAGPAEAHARVEVVRPRKLTTDKPYRSDWMHWSSTDAGMERMFAEQIPGEMIPYWTALHEVGHLLGLRHIGETMHIGTCAHTCQKDANGRQSDEYGYSRAAPAWCARNVMGVGSVVHDVDADPWLDRLVEHLAPDYNPRREVTLARELKAVAVRTGIRGLGPVPASAPFVGHPMDTP